MHDLTGLVAVTGFFTTIIVISYLYFSSRHKIRMALIQHGKEASIFKESTNGSSSLKYGMLSVGLGLGLLLGSIIDGFYASDNPVPYFSMMLMLGGAGLILYYVIIRKKGEDELVG